MASRLARSLCDSKHEEQIDVLTNSASCILAGHGPGWLVVFLPTGSKYHSRRIGGISNISLSIKLEIVFGKIFLQHRPEAGHQVVVDSTTY